MATRRPQFTIGLLIGIAAMLVFKYVPPLPLAMPPAEKAFIDTVVGARTAWVSAPNDVARIGMRQARAKAICRAVPGLRMTDWAGRIAGVSPDALPDLAGKATARISISLTADLTLSTPGDGLLNLPETMVEAGSPIYAVAATLPPGRTVVFSGRFVASGEDCAEEESFTDDGSMREPEFKVVLSRLKPK